MNPALFGDLAYQITFVAPLNSATGRFYFKTSGTDTGTVVTTSRAIDLSRALHLGATGGKPLDINVHPRAAAPPRFKSLTLAIPVKLNFKTGGKNERVYIKVDHKTSTASAGTYVTLKSETVQFKNGTDTGNAFLTGFASSVSLQGVKKFYKANLTFSFRKNSNTGAKDTTTGAAGFICFNPSVILSGGDVPRTVPAAV